MNIMSVRKTSKPHKFQCNCETNKVTIQQWKSHMSEESCEDSPSITKETKEKEGTYHEEEKERKYSNTNKKIRSDGDSRHKLN